MGLENNHLRSIREIINEIEYIDKLDQNSVKTHLETIMLYPVCVAVGLYRSPRAALEELVINGTGRSYRSLYKNMAH